MYKIKSKRKNIFVMCCMLLVFTLLAFSTLFTNNNNTYAETPDGVETAVSEEIITMYYLTLPTEDILLYSNDSQMAYDVVPWTTFDWKVFGDMQVLTNNRVHTFIFTYNNITVNGSALLTTWNIETETISYDNIFWGGYHAFKPIEDININIRSEYYELFEDGDFSSVSITYMYSGVGYPMQTNSSANIYNRKYVFDLSGATLNTREVPIDYDPIEEEGQAPDNGGINVDPYIPSDDGNWWDKYIPNLDLDGIFDNLIVLIVVIVCGVMILRYFKPKK